MTLHNGPAAGLTAVDAAARSSRLSALAYRLTVRLDGEADSFHGRVEIDCRLAAADTPLALDFAGGEVQRVEVAGRRIEAAYDGARIALPADSLVAGRNLIAVDFSHPYGRHGAGLHRLVDPEDNQVYLYSHFEPFDANRCFPCFDQPDLKASFELDVEAPVDWTVISAAREDGVRTSGSIAYWHFPPGPSFSTYLFSLHAGPFSVRESHAGDIPLRLFCRQTMAQHIDAGQWFDLTQRGFAFFQQYFAVDYPYGKYDCIVVPDFNIGAMENVAAVTFSEAYVPRGTLTRRDQHRLAEVVLHEMSHMWFGNLVTMPWWDGLWLKESFATYMAQLATDQAIGMSDIWHAFSVESRQRALRADQQVTTHPIDVPVPDTADAFAHFDAITYNKGASALAQLAHYVGPDAFRDGVRQYLSTHAGGTATLDDFVSALTGATNVPLDGWIDEWINTAGVNTLAAQLDCRDGKINRLTIRQSASAAQPTLRRHRVQLGLYRQTAQGRIETVSLSPLTIDGPLTRDNAVEGLPAPDLVCPNVADWSFALFTPDLATMTALRVLLPDVPEPMLRSQFVQALWDQVRDASQTLPDYLDIVLRLLEVEDNPLVCRHALGIVTEALQILARGGKPAAAMLARHSVQVDRLLENRLDNAAPDSDMRRLFIDGIVSTGRNAPLLERLLGVPPDQPGALDADRRWRALERLAALGAPAADELVLRETARDRSDRGQKMALAAESARPDEAAKSRRLERLLDARDDMPLSRQRMVLGALFPDTQASLHARFADRIVDALTDLSAQRDPAFLRAFSLILPPHHDEQNVARLKAAASQAEHLHPVLGRAVRVACQESARGLAIVQAASDADKSLTHTDI